MKARLPAGYGPQSQKDLMAKYQKMQEQMVSMQEELEAREYTATAGGGAVSVKMNGKKEITELTLKPEVVDPEDIEMLQDLVTAAVNEVIRNIEKASSDEMGKLTAGINIPGL